MSEINRLAMPDGIELRVYKAAAQGTRKGTVVLFHEIFGITDRIRGFCDRVAEHGYDALAPAIFDRVEPGYLGDISRLEEALEIAVKRQAFEHSLADASYLISTLKDTGPVFAAGFCYGGSLAFRIAQMDSSVAAACCFYGGMIPTLAGQHVLIPTSCHFGRKDSHIPLEGVERLIAMRPEVQTYLYDAGHGFVLGQPDDNPKEAAVAIARMFDLFESSGGRRRGAQGNGA
ncbi:dienelactone hydrolase family protein [Burkholderia anthina]|uniref:dienelactone hydrolase family protein n=1 Tax=Burkholderia anthina TaxID=179879 RepID=UPI00158B687A|nr:dienelactone hydrolase family protein [Burkholderia anthina]